MYDFLKPKLQNEDARRIEIILNILLFSVILLIAVAIFVSALRTIFFPNALNEKNNSISLVILLAEFGFFIFLYFLSRKGFIKTASGIFLLCLFLLATYMGYRWGIDLPVSMLAYAILIVMAGILISSHFAFISTMVIIVTMGGLGYMNQTGIVSPNRYWRGQQWGYVDVFITALIFFVIAVVSWLSNREIEKSLRRARKSEMELKKERDLLETTVEVRTREIKAIQAEKISQLYRFAEFGRLSSGVFHDLINPLTAISLTMEKLKSSNRQAILDRGEVVSPQVSEASEYVDKAVKATKKLEDLVIAVRKQLTRQENNTVFSLNEEIEYVIDVLSYKAQKAGVQIQFLPATTVTFFGDAIKFNQVALNLITNAIDAYEDIVMGTNKKKIIVVLEEKHNAIVFSVEDFGMGVLPEYIVKIFDPFFTTKAQGKGIGIGLSMTKHIIEKEFKGTISIKSNYGQGTMFSIIIPKNL
jgi:signal transduction histidine kinase